MLSKLIEAALPLHQSHDALRGHLANALMVAHGVTDRWSQNGPYVQDVFPGHVVYSHQGSTHKRTYERDKATPPKITLGPAQKIHVAYVDTKESASSFLAELDGEKFNEAATPLMEAAAIEAKTVIITEQVPEGDVLIEQVHILGGDVELQEAKAGGTIPVKLIAPGWGSSGYYSAEMLKRDGPKVFPEGLQMHWDHQTKTQTKESPVRSMATLAAVLSEGAKWDDNGKEGPGLYSRFKPFTDYAPKIAEKAKYSGVSINARGKVKMGEAEGRKGPIVEALTWAQSTDFVTAAGAGGKVLTESAANEPPKETTTMTEQEQTTLREAQDKAAKSEKALAEALVREHEAIAAAYLSEAFIALGYKVGVSALRKLAVNPPLKEGKVDATALKESAKEFVEAFSKQVKGNKTRNLGEGADAEDENAKSLKESSESLNSSLKEMGLSEAAVKLLA